MAESGVTLASGKRWQLGAQIGEGGMGTVYEATTPGVSGEHVIKLVPLGPSAMRERLMAERFQGAPYVVAVLDTGVTDDGTKSAFLMPRADYSLRAHLGGDDDPQPILEAEALPILIDIAHGLVSLADTWVPGEETKGVVHRDLKPENVLFLNGRWCLSDFGIARLLDKNTAAYTLRRHTTDAYTAPECWKGEEDSAQADVYAFGITAFEMLMGFRPFRGASIQKQHLNNEAPPITGVSTLLNSYIMACLSKLPEMRPLPERLLTWLERLADPSSSAADMSMLREANMAETIRLDREARQAQEERERAQRHAERLRHAVEQWQHLSDALRSAILDNAFQCELVQDNHEGWKVRLGRAFLHFHAPRERSSFTNNLPFDVIASCDVGVDGGSELTRFTHSLWFCNEHAMGNYAWHEVAFITTNPAVDSPIPFATEPDSDVARSALSGRPHRRAHSMAFPFTPIGVGEIDDFVSRWATFFGSTAQGISPLQVAAAMYRSLSESHVPSAWERKVAERAAQAMRVAKEKADAQATWERQQAEELEAAAAAARERQRAAFVREQQLAEVAAKKHLAGQQLRARRVKIIGIVFAVAMVIFVAVGVPLLIHEAGKINQPLDPNAENAAYTHATQGQIDCAAMLTDISYYSGGPLPNTSSFPCSAIPHEWITGPDRSYLIVLAVKGLTALEVANYKINFDCGIQGSDTPDPVEPSKSTDDAQWAISGHTKDGSLSSAIDCEIGTNANPNMRHIHLALAVEAAH